MDEEEIEGWRLSKYIMDGNGQLYDGKQGGQAVRCVEIEKMLERIIAEDKRTEQ